MLRAASLFRLSCIRTSIYSCGNREEHDPVRRRAQQEGAGGACRAGQAHQACDGVQAIAGKRPRGARTAKVSPSCLGCRRSGSWPTSMPPVQCDGVAKESCRFQSHRLQHGCVHGLGLSSGRHGSRRGQTGIPSVDKPVDKRCSVSPGRGQWLKEEAWGRGCRPRLPTGTHSSGLCPPAVSIRTRSGVMAAEAPGNESFTVTVACRTGLGSLWSLCGLFRLVFLRRYDSMESWLHKVCVARYGTNVPMVIAWRRAIGKNADTSRIKWAIVASDSDRCIHQRVLQVRSARWPRS